MGNRLIRRSRKEKAENLFDLLLFVVILITEPYDLNSLWLRNSTEPENGTGKLLILVFSTETHKKVPLLYNMVSDVF